MCTIDICVENVIGNVRKPGFSLISHCALHTVVTVRSLVNICASNTLSKNTQPVLNAMLIPFVKDYVVNTIGEREGKKKEKTKKSNHINCIIFFLNG
tara:strand:- start:4354 stop:4644 length:291 start_codon:yes stop_codon:yes gene_type:complete